MSKECISALCYANGMHCLKLAVVGKSMHPRVLKECMRQLPVIYYHSKNTRFNCEIFDDWLLKHFIPDVRKYQEEVMKLDSEDIKAILQIHNVPAHPSAEKLISSNGKIHALFLPPNTTSIIQPMDQGVIVSCKRLYQRGYLDEVLVVLEDEDDDVNNTRGICTLANIKKYNLKSAIFNFAAAWKDVKISTLDNSWKKLLLDTEPELDFEGFEVTNFHCVLHHGRENNKTMEDVETWLEENEGDPGYQLLLAEEIADVVCAVDKEDDDAKSSEGEESCV
ncbi:tigger transposable element-derived protein 7-like [Homarus americanus]|uniref:tigger transposable element-derived protein 7-like n=1 Tax=Homarus americanus TaxID=6706 RepID=UPI001C4568B4|nr:tigger transposable element-derived protein 7-like [Homarus americanus]